jgi:myo-inositol-1(or 4)-monophosphatase
VPNYFKDALAIAVQAGREAAQVHKKHLGSVAADAWSEKGTADFVTYVDKEAEARIVETIRSRFPDHDILAEEAAGETEDARSSDWLWIIDPLDGTTNFLHQYPVYCVSIALLNENRPVVAVVVNGATGELWTATEGSGAFLNDAPITVSTNQQLDRALIGTGFPFKAPAVIERYLEQFRAVFERVADIRRAGSAALDLCHVATGYFDGFWELDLRPWDYAAGTLMIREAGGVITNLNGAEPDWVTGGGIIAGNARVYSVLREILQ